MELDSRMKLQKMAKTSEVCSEKRSNTEKATLFVSKKTKRKNFFYPPQMGILSRTENRQTQKYQQQIGAQSE